MVVHPQHSMIRSYILGGIAAIGASALICLLTKDALGLVIAGIMAGVTYYYGFQKVEAYDYKTAQTTCIVVGVICVILGFVTVVTLGILGIIGLAAGGLLIYAWHIMSKPTLTVPTTVTPPPLPSQICPYCGASAAPDAIFCTSCGRKIR